MELTSHFTAEQILTKVTAKDRFELIEKMSGALLKNPVCNSFDNAMKQKIIKSIRKREEEKATTVGNGFIFPHARVKDLRKYLICIATLHEPLENEITPDGIAPQIACMVVTPEHDPTVSLRVMGAISKMMQDEATKFFFISQTDPEKLYNYIKDKSIGLEEPLKARDIMRPTRLVVHPEMPLSELTPKMQQKHVEAVSVVNDNGEILGQITCDRLFNKGIPDFFNQLASVSFIKNFDPFERYFAEESNAVAKDVMSSDYSAVNEDATLMEVLYQLSVKKYPKVYVLRDNKKIGTIDRITVLDKILNL